MNMTEQAVQNYLRTNHFDRLDVKAVFFDMDGVLFDSMPNHAKAWVKALNESGLPFTEHEAYLSEGQPGVDTINHVYSKLHGQNMPSAESRVLYDLKGKYFQELGDPEQMPYSYELLKKLKEKGLSLYVVTGSGHKHLIGNIMTHFSGIFTKERIITAFDVKRGKPNPDPYLKALKLAGIEPWQALVVENAPLGVQAAHAAKIFTIAVNTGPLDDELLKESGADLVLDSMEKLFLEWDHLHLTN